MKFTKHQNESLAVARIDAEGIWIDGKAHAAGLLLFGNQLISPWQPAPLDLLELGHLTSALNENPEIIILGCGVRTAFAQKTLLRESAIAGIGLEVMTNDAACRTYNVLQSEHRSVALAIPGEDV